MRPQRLDTLANIGKNLTDAFAKIRNLFHRLILIYGLQDPDTYSNNPVCRSQNRIQIRDPDPYQKKRIRHPNYC